MGKYLLLWICLLPFLDLMPHTKPLVVNIERNTYKAANKNWAIGQDEKGVMYFGNDVGLLESDGMEWKLHRLSEFPIVRALAIQSHQTIYTGGFEEMGRWDRDVSGALTYTSFKHLLPPDSFRNENIWRIWIDRNNVYFQSFSCIYIYADGVVSTVTCDNGLLFLSKVRDEYLVQEMYGALYRLENGKLHEMRNCDFLKGNLVRVILPYGEDQYLIGTSSGEIYLYDGIHISLWNNTLSSKLKGKELNCGLFSAHRGVYYLGTQLDGVYEVDLKGEVVNHFTATVSLSNNTILAMYEDNRKDIWLAMDRGLAYIHYSDRLNYFNSITRDAGAIYDIALWKDKIFIGTNQGVFYAGQNTLNEQDFFSHLQLIKGTQGQVWSFSRIDGRLFCGHNSGLLEITSDLIATDRYGINTGVYRVLETEIQNVPLLLVVTYKKLLVIHKTTGEVLGIDQISDPINAVEVDHLGNVWLETVSSGVYKCKFSEDLRTFLYCQYFGRETNPDLPKDIRLFKSGERILFLGNDNFWSYDESSDTIVPNRYLNRCFASVSNLRKIVYISGEQSWAITESSVYRFYYDGYTAHLLDSHNIDSDNLSLITGYEHVSVLNDTLSMICLDAGFIRYTSQQKTNARTKLSVLSFESIQGEGTGSLYLQPGNEMDIPYNSNNITVHFTVNNAFDPGVFVEYRLWGVDKNWSKPVRINRVTYDRLPEGEYLFSARVSDGLGHYSKVSSLAFRVLPPWYRTIWAYILYVAALFLLLYVVWVAVLRRYRTIHLQKLRVREARYLRMMNEKLLDEIKQKNAELLTQTSFTIQRNELTQKLKSVIDEFFSKNNQLTLQPLYRKMNELLNNNMNSENDWKAFLIQFEQKHDGFFKHLKEMHPQLTQNDLRLCACLKLNLDTKDIASLMNLSVRAIENNRYRLRKKLHLPPTQNLNEYFLKID